MSNVDWAGLEAAAQEGGTSYLEAMAGQNGGQTGGYAGAVTSVDSNGLPQVGGTGSPLVPSLPPNATLAQQEQAAMAEYNTNPQLQQYIQQTYGYIGSYMLAIPELLPILVSAGLENWSQGQFDAAIVQTNWWKSTSQAQRNFQEIQQTNPGEAQQQVAQMQNTILGVAQSLGVTVPPDQLKNLATFATTFGWNTDTIQQTLRAGGGFSTPSTAFGQTATFANQVQQLAGEYGLDLNGMALAQMVNQNVAGKLTADGVQQQFKQMAQQMNPWMSQALENGVTVSQYLSGYASAAGKTLEVDPNSIDWSDPKYRQALLKTNPDGTQAPVGIGEFQQNLMKNPVFGYQNTQGARDQAFATAQTILQNFGKVKS